MFLIKKPKDVLKGKKRLHEAESQDETLFSGKEDLINRTLK